MTGPEHYREAARLLQGPVMPGSGRQLLPQPEDVARAQAHATLALTALLMHMAPELSTDAFEGIIVLKPWGLTDRISIEFYDAADPE
jgi:hypothetical protein